MSSIFPHTPGPQLCPSALSLHLSLKLLMASDRGLWQWAGLAHSRVHESAVSHANTGSEPGPHATLFTARTHPVPVVSSGPGCL